jgi:hypothetical protein
VHRHGQRDREHDQQDDFGSKFHDGLFAESNFWSASHQAPLTCKQRDIRQRLGRMNETVLQVAALPVGICRARIFLSRFIA